MALIGNFVNVKIEYISAWCVWETVLTIADTVGKLWAAVKKVFNEVMVRFTKYKSLVDYNDSSFLHLFLEKVTLFWPYKLT